MIAPTPHPTPAARLIRRVESVRRERPERALRVLEREFSRAARAASPRERGELWRLRGHVLRGLRMAREAAAAYARAERCYARAGDGRERGRCAIGWVDALLYLGRYREAMHVARMGRRHLAAAKDRVSLGRLLNNEANVLHRLDLPERALERYRQARASLRKLGDSYEWAQMGVNEGNCLSLLGECAAARRHYQAALEAAERKQRPLDALRAGYNLAYLEFLEHRHEAALESLSRLGDRSRALGYPSIAALARLDRAEILLRMGAHGEALEEARAAIDACAAIGLRYEQAKAGTFAALAGFRLGQRQAAAERLEQSLEAFHEEGNAVWIGEALVGLATLWWRERQPLAAAALLQAATLHFATARDHERESCALALVVRARLAAGDRRGARRARERLKRRRVPGGSPRREHLALAAEAAWARAEGDLPRERPARPRSSWRRVYSTSNGAPRSGASGAGRIARSRRSSSSRAASARRSKRWSADAGARRSGPRCACAARRSSRARCARGRPRDTRATASVAPTRRWLRGRGEPSRAPHRSVASSRGAPPSASPRPGSARACRGEWRCSTTCSTTSGWA